MSNINGSECTHPALPSGGRNQREKSRALPLSSTFNFRDLGGYRTADGRKTRWGVLYRSAGLKDLSQKDQKFLRDLGLKAIVDFRSKAEQTKEPDRIPRDITYKHMPIDAGGQELRDNLKGFIQGKVSFELTDLMLRIYIQLVQEYTPVYREWIQSLIHSPNTTPLVFHCTAGKDRTGFGAALVLRLLGVPEETVLEDYLLTNHYNRKKNNRIYRKIRLANFFRANTGDVSPMLNADRNYLAAAFSAIEEKWGDFETYSTARDGLALTFEDIGTLKNLLLED